MSSGAYMTFATEREYRAHIGEVVGKRIGREQRKLEDERERNAELQERVDDLEAENASLRRQHIGKGTPLYPG